MGDAITALDGEGVLAQIEEDDADLATVIAVNGAGGVGDGDTVAKREAASGAHLALPPGRNLQREAGGDEPPLTGGELDGAGEGGSKVGTGTTRGGGLRKRQALAVRQAPQADSHWFLPRSEFPWFGGGWVG